MPKYKDLESTFGTLHSIRIVFLAFIFNLYFLSKVEFYKRAKIFFFPLVK